MGLDLQGVRIAVLGGDRRHLFLIPELVRLGASVTVVGFPPSLGLEGVCFLEKVEVAVENAQVVILPIPGPDPQGKVKTLEEPGELTFTIEVAKIIPPGTLVLVGVAQEFLHRWALQMKWKLVEVAKMDEYAILNSIPTAEGALKIAIEELPITVHHSKSFVLGFGRLGRTLARMLQALGAQTTVVARREAHLARIFEMGCRAVPFSELSQVIPEAEIIFNTVPALVLTRDILSLVQKGVLIIDLASVPGGTDFQAAEELGLKAILAPGLPGKVAPATSGRILAQIVPRLILRELSAS
ncbi:MAG: SpoVFA: dipicolinate synthase subunit A [Thermoanaerobacterales bacterium 50_218]|nr:MAG: SpoVFA: dipicolinate synthase subunit A [Thermoanaerobacterales bacterium 50_218]HAA90299.1 dipicolinic acid synthetase subunit A [Peptococcaceae bacterium]